MCVCMCVCAEVVGKAARSCSAALSPAEQLRPVYRPPESRRGEANGTQVDCRGTLSRRCRRGVGAFRLSLFEPVG